MRVLLCLLVLTSCGYRFQDQEKDGGAVTISIPYIQGDESGQLNTELIRVVSADPHFEYRQNGGMVSLQVAIINNGDDRIGYRYDRNPSSGKRRKNIVATENRRHLTAEVKLIDVYTEEVLIGPVHVKARADYDYVDSNSVRDLTFTNSEGVTQTVINFSMGQLDSIEGGQDDAAAPIYRMLAQKILDGLISQGY